jgi:ABC-type sugar transport system permease subunit
MLDFSAAEIEAVRLSLRIAFWAVVGSLPFGLATAIVLARGRFYGKSLLDGVVHLPLVMPPVVTGYLLLLLFGPHGPLGRFLDESFGIVFAFRTRRRCRRAEAHSRLDSAVIRRVAHRRSPGTALGPAPFRRLKPCSKSISSTASPISRSTSTFEPDAA